MDIKQDPESGLRACETFTREIKVEASGQSSSITPTIGDSGAAQSHSKDAVDDTGVKYENGNTSPDLFGSYSTSTSPPPSESTWLKLDLPEVCNLFKYQHFKGTGSGAIKIKKKRSSKEELDPDFFASFLQKADRNFPKKVTKKTAKQSNSTASSTFFSKHLKSLKTATPKSLRGNDCYARLASIFKWVRRGTSTGSLAYTDLENPKSSNYFEEAAEILDVTEEQLKNFRILPDLRICSYFTALQPLLSHLVYPDLAKLAAFSEWQSTGASHSKCAYYLSESHGTHLRSEIVDKHCLFFCKKQEMGNKPSEANDSQEKLRKKVFITQIKDSLYFGASFEEFSESLNEINRNWNIVQLSAMAFGSNRFGSELTKFKHSPPLFVTSFSCLPGETKRTSFVVYLRSPKPSDNLPHGILEEFKKVMIKNRHINEGYTGSKSNYWKVREEHNKHLSAIIESMEKDWIGPYAVLFPGNVKNEKLRKELMKQVNSCQVAAGRKLASSEKIYLYKLMENFKIVDCTIESKLSNLVSAFLRISTARADAIVQVIQAGVAVPADAERWPTILILDSELEQLPWDWMPCLRTTSVTRMASVSAIFSAQKVMKISRPKFPEIVDASKCTYILNPDQTLMNVQKRLESFFSGYSSWNGIVGRKPLFGEMENALQNHDAMIYCGHGSGITFFPEFALQRLLCKASPILMGCSSAQYRYNGPKANSSSIVSSYLIAACPSIVGFLWEITDVECDRVTTDMILRWLPGKNQSVPSFPQFDSKKVRPKEKCLATAMLKSRKAATQFLTEAALVNYGLPIDTR